MLATLPSECCAWSSHLMMAAVFSIATSLICSVMNLFIGFTGSTIKTFYLYGAAAEISADCMVQCLKKERC
jgi:hypothetical protein